MNAKTPKLLSISIAAYNVEDYLADTLESIVRCSGIEKIEVIIVNDGSTDGTARVAREYCNSHPDSVVLIDKPNGGYGSTINASLAVAAGKYYRLVDGDDWCDTDALADFVNYLSQCDADMVVTPFVTVRGGDESLCSVDGISYDGVDKPLEECLESDFPMHAVTFKTEMLRKGAIDITEHAFYTDREFVVKCVALAKSVAFVDCDVYRYRLGRDGQSISWKSWFKNIDGANRVSLEMVRYYCDSANAGLKEPLLSWLKNEVVGTAANKFRVMLFMGPSEVNRRRMTDYDRALRELDSEICDAALNYYKRVALAASHDYRLYFPVAALSRLDVLARMALGH